MTMGMGIEPKETQNVLLIAAMERVRMSKDNASVSGYADGYGDEGYGDQSYGEGPVG